MKTGTVKERKILTHDVFELTFEVAEAFTFQAGQFVTIKIDDKVPPCFRAYSIASSPLTETTEFKLCVKLMPGGRGSNWLYNLKVGDTANFIGPNGYFTFKESTKNVIFVATGTGVAPFMSTIEDEINKGSEQKLELIFGVRHIKDIFYKEWLDELKSRGNFDYTITLSQPEDESWQGSKGRVTELLKTHNFDPENTIFYICGLKDMIDAVTAILKEKGVPEDSIHFEKYD